jgi:hypothetical protein
MPAELDLLVERLDSLESKLDQILDRIGSGVADGLFDGQHEQLGVDKPRSDRQRRA